MKLATKGTPVHLPAEVIIRRSKRVRNSNGPSTDTWEMVRARGHLDEVEQLKSSAAPPSSARGPAMHDAYLIFWRPCVCNSVALACTSV